MPHDESVVLGAEQSQHIGIWICGVEAGFEDLDDIAAALSVPV
jgi:hypothetical protein